MVRFAARVSISVLVLSLMLGGIRATGSLSKPPVISALWRGSCVLPCWHGIQPGVTTYGEAEAVLRTDETLNVASQSRRTLCWVSESEPPLHGCMRNWGAGDAIEDIVLYLPDNALRLGDALALLGTPKLVRMCWISGYSYEYVLATLYFGNNVEIAAYSPHHHLRWLLEPSMSVTQIIFLADDSPHLDSRSLEWRGFVAVPSKGCGEQ
jgi:hypothetical protein